MTYISPFKRRKVSQQGMKKIEHIQQSFDDLYRQLHKDINLPKSFELGQASKKMQEACMWYTRACAINFEENN